MEDETVVRGRFYLDQPGNEWLYYCGDADEAKAWERAGQTLASRVNLARV